MNKSLKLWVSTHQKELLDKQVFIFLCGLQIEEGNKVIQNNLGKEFFSTLCYVDCLGGVIDYSKMNFIEKKIINMINKKVHMFAYDKQIGVYNMLQENRIQSFIQKIYDN